MTPGQTYEFYSSYRATVRLRGAVVSHVNIVARSSIEAEELALEFTLARCRQLSDVEVCELDLDVKIDPLDSPDFIANWLGPRADDLIAMRKHTEPLSEVA